MCRVSLTLVILHELLRGRGVVVSWLGSLVDEDIGVWSRSVREKADVEVGSFFDGWRAQMM